MSSPPTTTARTHPVHRFAGRLHQVLDDLVGQGVPATWSLSTVELTETLAELTSALPRLQALQLALLAAADHADAATAAGAVNTAALLRGLTRTTGPEATRLVRTAHTVEEHPATATALTAGRVNLAQAREILTAVDTLPDTVSAEDRDRAEQHLLGAAGQHDARALRTLGRHLLEVIDPDHADQLLAARLEQEETAAARACFLTCRDDGDGTISGEFKIPKLPGVLFKTMLQAVANPTLPDPIDREHKTRPEVLGEAFCRLIERYPINRLPKTGGMAPTVVVTIPLETLEGRLKAANILGTDQQLSPGEARRLACAAGAIPAVLDGDSVVLDQGRSRRYHDRHQRLAMTVQQDGRCAVVGCDRPTTLADAHHAGIAWADGGGTNTRHGALVCPRHHSLAHSTHIQVTRLGTGKLRFHRRT